MRQLLAGAWVAGACWAQDLSAALTVALHPDGSGGVNVKITGSGVTDASCVSQLCNGITFGEQWSNMTGNPFNDVSNPNNSVHNLTTPIQLAAGVFITGIEVDNDNTGPDQDDFRIFIDANMSTAAAYSANGASTLAQPLNYTDLSVGTYTDPTDGGSTFLGGFTLEVSDQVLAVPEPAHAAWGVVFAGLGLGLRALGRRGVSRRTLLSGCRRGAP